LLGSDASQQTLKLAERNLKSFLALKKKQDAGYWQDPINLPRYLPKNGRYILIYPKEHLKCHGSEAIVPLSFQFRKEHNLKRGEFRIPIPKQVNPNQLKELRILPCHGGYKSQWVYEVPDKEPLSQENYLAIDLGVNNFATCVESVTGTATIYDGRLLKSINQYYNKKNAKLQSIKDKQGIKGITNRQHKLLTDRSNKINDVMNKVVYNIVQTCIEKNIGTVLIGELRGIKQEINHGSRNNQNFVQIPFARFKSKLTSKCKMNGIEVKLVDESYTSKCDSLSGESVEPHDSYLGSRVKRGLFKSGSGKVINADVNGALNILRKVSDESPVKGIISKGLVFRPVSCQVVKLESKLIKLS
jgi:IS605 OrfB family transposase